MKDPRIEKLAEILINYSTDLKPGEKILIENIGNEVPLTKELIKQAYEAGGMPFLNIRNTELLRVLLNECTEEQLKDMLDFDMEQMEEMDAYIGLRAAENVSELGAVPSEKMKLYTQHYLRPLTAQRVKNTKWCVMRYPNHSMAQLASMATELFEDFYFKVCNLDYSKMSKAMDSLVKIMENTDKVRITGKDTDLTFSIKGLPAIKCDGKMNIPDGEVFTAPVRESVNGVITYNAPAVYQGVTFENIRLE
ncbi:MAG: aminopeptidase, partial [Clostridia bacterium]|nr:aminopeptidase [Clostridia bacterium]